MLISRVCILCNVLYTKDIWLVLLLLNANAKRVIVDMMECAQRVHRQHLKSIPATLQNTALRVFCCLDVVRAALILSL